MVELSLDRCSGYWCRIDALGAPPNNNVRCCKLVVIEECLAVIRSTQSQRNAADAGGEKQLIA
jgi:hypothetical protein